MKKTVHREPVSFGSYLILILYSALVIIPIIYAVMNSFKTGAEIQMNFFALPESLNLEAYKDVLTIIKIGQGYKNNVIIMLISLGLTIFFSSLAALPIAVLKTRFLKTVYTVLIMVICIPINAYIFQLIPLLQKIGLYNTYTGTSFVFTAISVPVSVFLYSGFAQSIPGEIYEAAALDGCDLWQTYFHVFMPLLNSVTCTVLILRGTYIWNNLLVSLVTITDPSKTMLIPRTYAFNSSTATRWDLVLASSVLVSIPVCLMYIFLQKYFVGNVTAGAVKG